MYIRIRMYSRMVPVPSTKYRTKKEAILSMILIYMMMVGVHLQALFFSLPRLQNHYYGISCLVGEHCFTQTPKHRQ